MYRDYIHSNFKYKFEKFCHSRIMFSQRARFWLGTQQQFERLWRKQLSAFRICPDNPSGKWLSPECRTLFSIDPLNHWSKCPFKLALDYLPCSARQNRANNIKRIEVNFQGLIIDIELIIRQNFLCEINNVPFQDRIFQYPWQQSIVSNMYVLSF